MGADILSRKALIYSSTTFGSRIISTAFNFYYVKIFLDKYNMNQTSFQASQFIFAFWNAVNDPWFGYFQDTAKDSWVKVRRKCILYGAFPWVLTFLLPWFPWADYTDGSNGFLCFLQGLSSLCLFDTFFTFCLLAHCALMTEYGETDEERLQMVKYNGVAGILGSSCIFITDHYSAGLTEYGTFQFICLLMAVVALAAFYITGKYAVTQYESAEVTLPSGSYWSLTKDIFKNKNFRMFVVMNFLQELHITYVISFAMIFTEQLIPMEELSSGARSILLGALMMIAQVAVVVASPIVAKVGLYRVEMATFYLKIALGLIMYFSGAGRTIWYMLFLIVDYTLSDGAFSFFSINLSDIADEDMKINGRKKPIASMVYGSNAAVVKPALSLAPMVVAAMLSRSGYDAVKAGTATPEQTAYLQQIIFTFSCFAPVIIGSVQIFAWRQYRLRGK
ncbi:transmembrane protein 180-like isoform X2 [Watersipora subatra]|uniref:transmembrane protein 180-like isoform X2 n=1 Tax=Watersipora subatra TaxID=2589382 RepID=UPI00355B649C